MKRERSAEHDVLDEMDDDLTARRGKLSLAASRSGSAPSTKGPQDVDEEPKAGTPFGGKQTHEPKNGHADSHKPGSDHYRENGPTQISKEHAGGLGPEHGLTDLEAVPADHQIFRHLCADCSEKTKHLKK